MIKVYLDWNVMAQMNRITSYNVCYTKLLRKTLIFYLRHTIYEFTIGFHYWFIPFVFQSKIKNLKS